ncbi:hypothetical protein D9M68_914590 [compost metagenome]
MRWELHRVWVVEATLKPGFRHLIPKRRFYLDEDVSAAGITDNYDATGKLIRIDTMLVIPNYVSGYGLLFDNTNTLDLERGAYIVPAFTGFKGGGYRAVDEIPASTWASENMAQTGIR